MKHSVYKTISLTMLLTLSNLQYCMMDEFEQSIKPDIIVMHYHDWKSIQFQRLFEYAKPINLIQKSLAHGEKSWYMNEMIKTVERNIAFHENKHMAAILANIKALKKVPSQS